MKWFFKYIRNKRRAKEDFHLLLDVGGITVAKEEEKAEAQREPPCSP